MTITTAEFSSGLAGLTISGVTTKYPAPPSQVGTLPCSYPRLPTSDQSEISSFDSSLGLRSVTVELVILVNYTDPVTHEADYALGVSIVDALHSVLAANAAALNLDRWVMRGEFLVLGETTFWAVIAAVDASN